VLLLTGCDPHFVGKRATDAEIHIMKQKAHPIIEAIEAYVEDQGRYPNELAELIPDYLPEIPASGWGDRHWKYQLWQHPSPSFGLYVLKLEGYYEGLYYQSSNQSWIYDS
jgi:hypothetical protein